MVTKRLTEDAVHIIEKAIKELEGFVELATSQSEYLKTAAESIAPMHDLLMRDNWRKLKKQAKEARGALTMYMRAARELTDSVTDAKALLRDIIDACDELQKESQEIEVETEDKELPQDHDEALEKFAAQIADILRQIEASRKGK